MRISDWSSDVVLFRASDDEYIRTGVTLDSVSAVRPAFKKDGTVTAANASGINDGAAALVLMTADEAARRNAPVLARVASWAHAGVDPSIMGIGPVPATKRALQKAGWTINDLDLVEEIGRAGWRERVCTYV